MAVSPYIFQQELDDNGDPLNAATVDAYEANNAPVRKPTYNSAALTTANSNPVVLSASGRTVIFLESGTYDFVLKNSAGSVVDTKDGIEGSSGAGAGSVLAVEDILELKALTSNASTYVDVAGYYDKGDGGGGRFYWDAASSAGDNTGTIIEPDSAPSTGRWIRNYDKFIRVEWFGTVGDGVTDDTNSIISAVALSSGKELQFGNGTFLVTAVINLLTNTTVIGIGKALITSTNTAGAIDGFHVLGMADGCRVYNMHSSGSAVDKAGYAFISTQTSDDIIIENCVISGYGECILVEDTDNIKITDCILDGSWRWTLIMAKTTNAIITGNSFINSVDSDGIKINGRLNADPVTNYDSNFITISNNICSGNGRDGIDMASGGDSILIQSNNCRNNSLNGIECKAHIIDVTTQRILIKDNACIGNTFHGIRIDDVAKSHVTGNTVEQNGDEGILAQNNIQQCMISDNLIQDNSGNGIRFSGGTNADPPNDSPNPPIIVPSVNNVILNNRCINNGVGDNGISIGNDTEELIVQGNSCYQLSAGKTNSGIGITGTQGIIDIKIIGNYCPQDKLDNGSNVPISMGSWDGSSVYTANNITFSTAVFSFDANDAIPEVAGGNPLYQTANSSPTNVTGFDQNSYEMGEFKVLVNDANTTFVHGANFVLLGGVNYAAPQGSILTFICQTNIFKEVSRVDSNGGTSQDTTITNDLTVGNDISITGSMTFETASEKILVPNAFSLEHDAGASGTSELFIKSKGSLEAHIDSDNGTTNAEMKFFKDGATRIATLGENGNLDLPIGGLTANTSILATTLVTGTTGLRTSGSLIMDGTSKKIQVSDGFIMDHESGAGANAEIAVKSNHNVDIWIDFDNSSSAALFRVFHNVATELFRIDETGLVDIKVGGLNITGQLNSKAAVVFSGTETIAAGGTTTALDITKSGALIDADAGGDIFTLGGGTEGQIFECVCLSATGLCTITPGVLAGGTSVTLNAAGESVRFRWFTSSWYIMGGNAFTVI